MVRRYRGLTVTRLTVYVRRTVNVAKSTPDRCARTHGAPWVSLVDGDVADGIRPSHCEGGAPWVDSLHTYCHLAPSVAIKRERVERF